MVVSFYTSYADTTNYVYDELNRLMRVEYEDGTKIVYTYDEVGNRSEVYVGEFTLAVNVVGSGTVTKNPDQPVYSAATSVTLTAVNGSQGFTEWSGDLTGSTNPTNIVMDGDKSVTATFVTPENWLQGWTYRKAVTLSRASGAVTNYQMKLLVGESSGAAGENVDCNSHVLSTFNDLRFTTSDGMTPLDYWIESITGTTPNRLATVWIKFDSIGTTATTFYMYYGNSGAGAYSNGPNTFLFFDDFETGNLSRWTLAQTQWSDQTTTKYTGSYAARGDCAASNRYLKETISLNGTFRIHFYVRFTSTSSPLYFLLTQGTTKYPIEFGTSEAGKAQYYDGTYKDFSTPLTFAINTWYECDLYIDVPNNQYQLSYGTAGSALTTVNNVTTVLSGGANITGFSFTLGTSGGISAYVDGVWVRNNNSTEPAWGAWGAEEAN
jgi:YD repeat-containing protein